MNFRTLAALLTSLSIVGASAPVRSERVNWLLEPEKTTPVEVAEETKEVIEEEPKWAITKEQMSAIMDRPKAKISDALMDDFSRMVTLFDFDKRNIAYFLGQVAVESGQLKFTTELDPGYRYEWRRDLGNNNQGDGVKYAGGGYLQLTGKANYTGFYRYMKANGTDDPKILSIGKHHVAKHYPWTSGGWWWMAAGMIDYCKANPSVDRVGARVNGKYLPNHYQLRRSFTQKAFAVLGI